MPVHDELTIDTPRNRFVRAALGPSPGSVREDVAHRCRALAGGMKAMGVSEDAPTRVQMSTDRFGRNDADDRFMVAAARLAFDLVLPTGGVGCECTLSAGQRSDVGTSFVRAGGGRFL